MSHKFSTIINQCCDFQSNSTSHHTLSSKVKSHRLVPVKRYSQRFNQRSTSLVVGILINCLTRPLATKSFSIWLIYGAFLSWNSAMEKFTHLCRSIAIVAKTPQLFLIHWFNISKIIIYPIQVYQPTTHLYDLKNGLIAFFPSQSQFPVPAFWSVVLSTIGLQNLFAIATCQYHFPHVVPQNTKSHSKG